MMPVSISLLSQILRITLICGIATLLLGACSLRQMALDRTADALTAQGPGFAGDDDPELIRDAAPFYLKLVDSLLAERPQHPGLLLAAARGYTQYAYAYLQQEADEVEEQDVNAAYRLRDRAARLYKRAREYGLRGLAGRKPVADFVTGLRSDPAQCLIRFDRAEVALLYWTAAAWASWISLSRDNPEAVADLPLALTLLDRALALDEAWSGGAIHSLFITLEMSRGGNQEQATARARTHFERAKLLSHDSIPGPYVSLAEAVAIPQQDRPQFDSLLNAALAIDPDANPDARLENHIMQRRARWLQQHAAKFFME